MLSEHEPALPDKDFYNLKVEKDRILGPNIEKIVKLVFVKCRSVDLKRYVDAVLDELWGQLGR